MSLKENMQNTSAGAGAGGHGIKEETFLKKLAETWPTKIVGGKAMYLCKDPSCAFEYSRMGAVACHMREKHLDNFPEMKEVGGKAKHGGGFSRRVYCPHEQCVYNKRGLSREDNLTNHLRAHHDLPRLRTHKRPRLSGEKSQQVVQPTGMQQPYQYTEATLVPAGFLGTTFQPPPAVFPFPIYQPTPAGSQTQTPRVAPIAIMPSAAESVVAAAQATGYNINQQTATARMSAPVGIPPPATTIPASVSTLPDYVNNLMMPPKPATSENPTGYTNAVYPTVAATPAPVQVRAPALAPAPAYTFPAPVVYDYPTGPAIGDYPTVPAYAYPPAPRLTRTRVPAPAQAPVSKRKVRSLYEPREYNGYLYVGEEGYDEPDGYGDGYRVVCESCC